MFGRRGKLCVRGCLSYKVKRQYVQISKIRDTSVKTSNFRSIHSYGYRWYRHMFDIVDTPFSYRKALIVCWFLQESSKVKGSSLHIIWNAHTAFLLCVVLHTWKSLCCLLLSTNSCSFCCASFSRVDNLSLRSVRACWIRRWFCALVSVITCWHTSFMESSWSWKLWISSWSSCKNIYRIMVRMLKLLP